MKSSHAIERIRARLKSWGYVAACAVLSVASRVEGDDGLPIPQDLIVAQGLAEEVAKSEGMPAETKNQVNQQLAGIKDQCDKLRASIDASMGHAKERLAYWKQADVERQKEGQLLRDSMPRRSFTTQEAADAYTAQCNAKIASFNAETESLAAEAQAEAKTLDQDITDKQEAYDNWLKEGAIPSFNQFAKSTLAKFRQGPAYRQLIQAAKGADQAGAVIENSSPGGVVDARGIEVMTPAERLKKRQQPSVQLPRGFHVTPNSAPPPPSPR